MKFLLLVLPLLSISAFAQDIVSEPAQIWTEQCASCHAADGTGKTPKGIKIQVRDLTKFIRKMAPPKA